ncbi:hypothetical protein HMI54_002049 [Coelomomyces lativittatus]|nr:hypothetical protein HMI54_002049 [Coelomomyces lativittatus]
MLLKLSFVNSMLPLDPTDTSRPFRFCVDISREEAGKGNKSIMNTSEKWLPVPHLTSNSTVSQDSSSSVPLLFPISTVDMHVAKVRVEKKKNGLIGKLPGKRWYRKGIREKRIQFLNDCILEGKGFCFHLD